MKDFRVHLISTSNWRLWLLLTVLLSSRLNGQSFWTPTDTFNKGRFYLVAGVGTATYGSSVLALQQVWYEGFEKTSFHFFNDWAEWKGMDKAGHLFTAYFESEWTYRALRWTGVPERKAVWFGMGTGLLLQTTVEMFDAYSAAWGFSTGDMLFNTAGAALFAGQQWVWKDQRMRLKVSSRYRRYDPSPLPAIEGNGSSSLKRRTDTLFGANYPERFLKDYNAQSIWISLNLDAFFPGTNFPAWVNIAVGYSAENLFGARSNNWSEEGTGFSAGAHYQRYSQWFLSPDLDLRKIPTRNPLLKTFFQVLNIFKIPAPALEFTSRGKWKGHWLYR